MKEKALNPPPPKKSALNCFRPALPDDDDVIPTANIQKSTESPVKPSARPTAPVPAAVPEQPPGGGLIKWWGQGPTNANESRGVAAAQQRSLAEVDNEHAEHSVAPGGPYDEHTKHSVAEVGSHDGHGTHPPVIVMPVCC
mmetsp:Transcript_29834/g.73470  ORF Transcript_29834/g.73470 Transcript_29834/m.73470 type:complete len:140 (-) Transcript_29834:57-476(-)